MKLLKFLRWLNSSMNSPERLGRQGEDSASRNLDYAAMTGLKGYELRNLYIPGKNGYTTEIDLIYITRKGIFVIECKNYSGYIFGSEDHTMWTSTLYAGKGFFGTNKVEKHQFYNPIWQNRTHINFLRRYLKTELPFWSVVAFSDRCEFKDIEHSGEQALVCHMHQLRRALKIIWNEAPDVMTEAEGQMLYRMLQPLTNVTEAEKSAHIEKIKERMSDPERCPRCGGKLVVRTARSGPMAGHEFYGCSNYPNCRYTRNIPD